jgi:enamine deaminase RidA (YjgF/YER057c/UK114 family)
MRTTLTLVLAGSLSVLAASNSPQGSAAAARKHLNLPGTTSELPFSHAVLVGETLYVAGTLGLDAETGKPPADAASEARLALDGIRAKLALTGMTMDDLVTVQVFCPDLSLYDTFNGVYRGYFEQNFPARAFVGSGPLLRGCRFEINGVAVRR